MDQFWLLNSDVFSHYLCTLYNVHNTGKFVKHIENVKELFLMVYCILYSKEMYAFTQVNGKNCLEIDIGLEGNCQGEAFRKLTQNNVFSVGK